MAFSAVERFTLYDEDGAFLPSPMEELEIPEPTGFDSFEFSVVRGNVTENSSDPTKYFGFSNEFGEENSELGFDWNKVPGQLYSAREMLESILTSIGVDANVSLRYYRTVGGVESLKYEWYLIFDDTEEVDNKIFFPVKRQDFGDKLRTRFGTTIDLESDVDLDNNPNDPIELITLPLHSKATVFNDSFRTSSIYLTGLIPNTSSKTYVSLDYPLKNTYETESWRSTLYVSSDDPLANDMPAYVFNFARGTYEIRTSTYLYIYTYFTGFEQYYDWTIYISTDGITSQEIATGNSETNDEFSRSIDKKGYLNAYRIGISTDFFGSPIPITNIVDGDFSNQLRVYYWIEIDFGGSNADAYDVGVRPFEPGIQTEIKTYQPASTVRGAFIYEVLQKAIEKSTGQSSQIVISNSLSLSPFLAGEAIVGGTSAAEADIVFSNTSNMSISVDVTSGTFQVGENISSGNTIWKIDELRYVKILMDSPLTTSVGDDIEGFTSGSTGIVDVVISSTQFIVGTLDGSFELGEILTVDGATVFGVTIEEINLGISLKTFDVGETVTGLTSSGSGVVESYDSTDLVVSNVADFQNNEQVQGSNGAIAYSTLITPITGGIINSDFISKKEQGKTTDGYGSLNFITTGKKIRNLENAKLEISPQIPFEFLRCRYCFGWSIYDESDTTRIQGGQSWMFFNPVKIATLTNVENPVRRSISKDYLFNEFEFGYSKFSKENEPGSISGFNTVRQYAFPFDKVKNKLSTIAPCITDGADIERVRSIEKEKSDESDQSDDEVFVIKCQRFNSSNRISWNDAQEDWLVIMEDESTLVLQGYYLEGQLENVSSIFLSLPGELSITEFTITDIDYDSQEQSTILTIDEALPFPGDPGFNQFFFYFDVDIFLPERIENFSSLSGFAEASTEYNIDHTPSNMLIQWWHWLGSALTQKDPSRIVKFLSGKNNTSVGKAYSNPDGPYTSSQIFENQDFLLSSLSTYNTQLMLPFEWELTCYISFDTFDEIRSCLLGVAENSPDNNFGYLEFPDNFGNLVNIYVKSIRRVEKTGKTTIIGWEVDGTTPPPPVTHYLLREDGSYYLREDGSRYIREH